MTSSKSSSLGSVAAPWRSRALAVGDGQVAGEDILLVGEVERFKDRQRLVLGDLAAARVTKLATVTL